ncbi:SMP-30/gluconolactonase/LRE family protein [Dongia sedimenti]|uniref:SMP-30/gluconolactonase/LRE family protein n=1 Tax=Dongia sedimenti TaxID=3064282 RepID=A0ABU0YI71_9PROT|nr:SMP-30/gluconolactonase/LRE family protein [Rhodospirillaceae bacterium R-7]
MTEVRCLLEKRSVLGEGPIWRPRENSLYWIDLKAPAIYCFDVITRQNRQVPAALGKTIGGMVFARDGRMIVVDAEGVHDLNRSGHRNLLVNPESDQVGNAFNDAKCDPKGRLWSGTADIGETRQSGSLYVIEGQGQRRVRRIDSGIICSNGPAFAPDGRQAYFTDSFAQEIYCYDVDLDTGLIGARKSFFRCSPEAGYPDGMTVDSEGYLWCCNWDGWSVTRYSQTGEIDRVLKVPVPRPTSVCFGGPRMDQLFITSASDGLSADQLREAPLSGSLFVCEPGVKGLLDAEFNG